MNSQGSQEKNRTQTVHGDKKRRNPSKHNPSKPLTSGKRSDKNKPVIGE
jgi:hypothetical protein